MSTTTYTRQDFYHPVTTGFNSEDYGYCQKTTAWDDFSIADRFGQRAILDTYKSLLEFCGTDYVYLTELALILNWKIWQHYENANTAKAHLYDTLWHKHCAWCERSLKGEALDYYYRTTD